MSIKEPVFRQITFMKRRADLSVAEFQSYWAKEHYELVTALPVFRKHVLRYEQLYPAEGETSVNFPGSEGWDGVVVLDFASKEDWEAVTKSKEYVTATAADAPKFADITAAKRIFVTRVLQYTQ